MIPKIIYYCWFGHNKKSKLIKKCIKSWEKYCPEYKIVEINEENFDVNENTFCKQAYLSKKYAYVADYARSKIIYKKGGIYLDSDVQLLKPLDAFLDGDCFIGVEHEGLIESYLFGAIPGHRYINAVLNSFADEEFICSDGTMNFHTMPRRFTECFRSLYHDEPITDIQYNENDLTVFPTDYFQPIDFETEKLNVTDNTYAIHHYTASWYSPWKRFLKRCLRIFPRPLRRAIRKLAGKERTTKEILP